MADDLHGNQFNASMPLPGGDQGSNGKAGKSEPGQSINPAADLIRRKVQAAYANEPGAVDEIQAMSDSAGDSKLSRHQKFIYELTNSGKALPEIQVAWHEYYAGLPDNEKHQVWQEFYSAHAQASKLRPPEEPKAEPGHESEPETPTHTPGAYSDRPRRTIDDLKKYLTGGAGRQRLKPIHHLQSVLFGFGVGAIVVLLFLFSFFNERFIAPLIQPSRNITSTPIINDTSALGPNPEIIIPKINVEIPVVYGTSSINEEAVQKALEGGVVHYADTALPGQNGNTVIVGHSSNNIFNKGRYKFAFVLLSRLENGDTFYLQKDGKRYTYQIYKKAIVGPNDVSVLGPGDKSAIATLVTCDPPGTSVHRLIVVGEQISPEVSTNVAASSHSSLATRSAIIPGNSPSLWSRLWGVLSR